jgi:copper(I)-binding protein
MKMMLAILAVLNMGAMVFAAEQKAAESKAPSAAQEKLMFMEPTIILPAKGTNTTAGYVMMHNLINKEVKVKVVKADGFKAVETHATSQKGDRTAMAKVEGFTVPSASVMDLAPGGNHIMFFDGPKGLKVGDEVKVQFMIDDQPMDVKFKVVTRDETKKDEHKGHH